MKPLKPEATAIMLRFVDFLQEDQQVTIPLQGSFPIRLTREQPIRTTEGAGVLFSIGRLCDSSPPTFQPLLKVIVIEASATKCKAKRPMVYPVSFSDDVNGILQEACTIRDGSVQRCIRRTQASHGKFIHRWLKRMVAMGYLT